MRASSATSIEGDPRRLGRVAACDGLAGRPRWSPESRRSRSGSRRRSAPPSPPGSRTPFQAGLLRQLTDDGLGQGLAAFDPATWDRPQALRRPRPRRISRIWSSSTAMAPTQSSGPQSALSASDAGPASDGASPAGGPRIRDPRRTLWRPGCPAGRAHPPPTAPLRAPGDDQIQDGLTHPDQTGGRLDVDRFDHADRARAASGRSGPRRIPPRHPRCCPTHQQPVLVRRAAARARRSSAGPTRLPASSAPPRWPSSSATAISHKLARVGDVGGGRHPGVLHRAACSKSPGCRRRTPGGHQLPCSWRTRVRIVRRPDEPPRRRPRPPARPLTDRPDAARPGRPPASRSPGWPTPSGLGRRRTGCQPRRRPHRLSRRSQLRRREAARSGSRGCRPVRVGSDWRRRAPAATWHRPTPRRPTWAAAEPERPLALRLGGAGRLPVARPAPVRWTGSPGREAAASPPCGPAPPRTGRPPWPWSAGPRAGPVPWRPAWGSPRRR